MKILWKLSKEAIRYRGLYVLAVLATLSLTMINLAAPRVLSDLTAIVKNGVDDRGLLQIRRLTIVLIALYLLRVLFRFMSSYLSHKAAWYLVGDLRTKVYNKLIHMHLGFFHDKQTGDLMSRVINDTRDFELLYAHLIPETITNIVTFLGGTDHSSDNQYQTGFDNLCTDSADPFIRGDLCEKGQSLFPRQSAEGR